MSRVVDWAAGRYKLEGAFERREADTELVPMTQYLLALAKLDDFTAVDHSCWKSGGLAAVEAAAQQQQTPTSTGDEPAPS